jgi:integrase
MALVTASFHTLNVVPCRDASCGVLNKRGTNVVGEIPTMPRKPEGYAEKFNGQWRGRVTFTVDACKCDHPSAVHTLERGYRRRMTRGACTLCGGVCAKYAPQRREWRRVADPNTKAVALEIARQRAREIASGDYRGDDHHEPPAMRRQEKRFADLAALYIEAYAVPPRYDNGIKVSGMQDHAGVRSIITNVLVAAIGDRPVAELTYAELRALRDARLTAPKLRAGRNGHTVEVEGSRSLARVNREMATLRAVLNHGVDLRWIAANPMKAGRGKSLVVTSGERARERILSPAEEARMLKAFNELAEAAARAKDGATKSSAPDPSRTRDFVVTALDSGIRSGELRKVAAGHVDFEANAIRLPWEITKSKKARIVPMSSRVREIMARRCQARAADALVFAELSETIVRDDFAAACATAGIVGLQLRDLRATLATRLMAAGVSEAEIAAMTGHRFSNREGVAPVLRKNYLRVTPEALDRAAAAMDAAVN